MDQTMENKQGQFCPQCDNHCPVDALRCGRGRRYFGAADDGHDHGHGEMDGLAGLLQRCGRFVHHSGAGEDELFQALSEEEKAALQALLEKLSSQWKAQFGEEAMKGHGHHGHGGGEHHHKHGEHSK